MHPKTFSNITTISTLFSIAAVLLGIIGVAKSGLYPGIFILSILALIAIASRLYAKKITAAGKVAGENYLTPLSILNLLLILVVLWMTFVIVHDRVLLDK